MEYMGKKYEKKRSIWCALSSADNPPKKSLKKLQEPSFQKTRWYLPHAFPQENMSDIHVLLNGKDVPC